MRVMGFVSAGVQGGAGVFVSARTNANYLLDISKHAMQTIMHKNEAVSDKTYVPLAAKVAVFGVCMSRFGLSSVQSHRHWSGKSKRMFGFGFNFASVARPTDITRRRLCIIIDDGELVFITETWSNEVQ